MISLRNWPVGYRCIWVLRTVPVQSVELVAWIWNWYSSTTNMTRSGIMNSHR